MTLTSNFYLLLEKLNLDIDFWTERGPKMLQKLGGGLSPVRTARSSSLDMRIFALCNVINIAH